MLKKRDTFRKSRGKSSPKGARLPQCAADKVPPHTRESQGLKSQSGNKGKIIGHQWGHASPEDTP
jgi:hypothetical protein